LRVSARGGWGTRIVGIRGVSTVPLGLALWLLSLGGMASSPGAHHPNQVLVMPLRRECASGLERFQADRGVRVRGVFSRLGGLQVVRLAEGESVSRAIAAYRESGLVAYAEPDHVVSAVSVLPDDPYFQNGTLWWLSNYGQNGGLPDADLDMPEAWDVVSAATNVVVAVVDSGIRATHEDLQGSLWRNPEDGTPGFNALTGQHDPWDDNGHGTHLAGVIAAVANNQRGVAGVAGRAQLMACKFLDAAGNGYVSDAVACIEFARMHGAHIINLSWGGSEFSEAMSNALEVARRDGVLVAAAAGNNAANSDWIPYYPAGIALDHIVSVGASTRTDDRWTFSNHGAESVDLFAPGAAIYSTLADGDAAYGTLSGTSQAAACVAGALALLRQQEPGAAPRALIDRLLAAVDARPAFAGRCVAGGRLNVRKAVDLPRLSLASRAAPLRWSLSGRPGHRYQVAASTNLVEWHTLDSATLGASGEWEFEDAASAVFPLRFYRGAPGP